VVEGKAWVLVCRLQGAGVYVIVWAMANSENTPSCTIGAWTVHSGSSFARDFRSREYWS
jgi:hypothetical protein